MSSYTITPSLVTYVAGAPALKKYVDARFAEIKRLRLSCLSLFLTGADGRMREYIKSELGKTGITSIPHVHLKDDAAEKEAQYYYEQYGTKRFTTHYEYRNKFFSWSRNLRQCIGIENTMDFTDIKGLERLGGVVIDISHYVDARGMQRKDVIDKALERFPIIANHASAVRSDGWSRHSAHNKRQFDYIENVPKKCFSDLLSLEISNSFQTQMKYIQYINKVMSNI